VRARFFLCVGGTVLAVAVFAGAHGTGIALAVAILACELAVDVADDEEGHAGEDDVDDDGLDVHGEGNNGLLGL